MIGPNAGLPAQRRHRTSPWLAPVPLPPGTSELVRQFLGTVGEPAPALTDALRALLLPLAAQKCLLLDTRHVCTSPGDLQKLCLLLAGLLGEHAEQDADGARVVHVYDRGQGGMEQGVRYHQTRQGGHIHTDAVSHAEGFRYVLLACVAAAPSGGVSILVPAARVVSALPVEVLAILRRPFWFEARGMGSGLFSAPILVDGDGLPQFRYLRPYIEAAHLQAGQPLQPEQVAALDALDEVLHRPSLQEHLSLSPGQVLLFSDAEILHGRTAFAAGAAPGGWAPRRHLLRLWVR